ncbi:hypothetical protein RHMOL_Rhmol07G0132600 [Rhododendron molle]|uniref:Uncharacterized protein n=1 Tax=Rhododendron molle TaxID=49168 RepID=A0ACC0N235_RHOML|nr:hypothetical protein RHMOL_Rhmol07G0132600 [Rhododendron molle]
MTSRLLRGLLSAASLPILNLFHTCRSIADWVSVAFSAPRSLGSLCRPTGCDERLEDRRSVRRRTAAGRTGSEEVRRVAVTQGASPRLLRSSLVRAAAEHGAGVILTPPQGLSPRPLSVVARIPPVQVEKSEGEATAWTKQKILLTNEVKIGRLSKHLKKVPIVYENGQVMIPTNNSENGALKWKNAIVGCFVDKRLSYFQVRSWAQRVWKTDAEDVVTLDNGFFVFNFKDTDTLDSILENGPYFCGGKHIVIKKWHPGMHLTKGAFSSVPVWVKLYNVPLESWTEDGLSYIASYIGNSLYLDNFTQNHSRLMFARVCIEVDAAKEIPKSFVVNLGYGEPYEIRVEVPWKPQACNTCKIFGHTTNACTIQPQAPPSQVWKAKELVGQEVPVAQARIFKEQVGNEDKAWEEVKRKKDHRSPPSMPLVTSSPCHSGASSGVLRKDDMGNGPSEMVSSSCFDVLKSCDTNDYSSVTDQVSPIVPIHSQAKVPVAPRRSTRFRKPPRIPLEGDFVGPRHGSNPLVGESSSSRSENKRKLHEKINMLKASRA